MGAPKLSIFKFGFTFLRFSLVSVARKDGNNESILVCWDLRLS